MCAVVNQLDRRIIVDPPSAVQRRRRSPRDDSASFRPQPRSAGSVTERERLAARRADVWKYRPIPTRELMSRYDAVGNGFTTDEDLPHGQIMAMGTDNSRNFIP